jgi:hypothetical protein
VKLLWWTWHDTDPNIADRFYYAPWNTLYSQAAFACSFVVILKLSRALLVHEVYDWKKFGREFFCSLVAGSLAFWFGIAQLALLYHPAHDIFHISAALTTIVFLSIYAILVYAADRRNSNPDSRVKNHYFFDELSLAVCAFYLFLMTVVLLAKPENIVSEGLHQPIGPCNVTQTIRTPTGMKLQKDKFLCLKNYDEKYFDFHCVPGRKPLVTFDGEKEWYAICGTPFENQAEYVFLIWSICILSSAIFYQAAARSGRTPKVWHLIHRSPPPYHSSPKVSTPMHLNTTPTSKPKTRSDKKKE